MVKQYHSLNLQMNQLFVVLVIESSLLISLLSFRVSLKTQVSFKHCFACWDAPSFLCSSMIHPSLFFANFVDQCRHHLMLQAFPPGLPSQLKTKMEFVFFGALFPSMEPGTDQVLSQYLWLASSIIRWWQQETFIFLHLEETKAD